MAKAKKTFEPGDTDLEVGKIEVTGRCFVVWVNTDQTEGRGRVYPKALTAMKATAVRLAQGSGVQGTNAKIGVLPLLCVCVDHKHFIYGPVHIDAGTDADKATQHSIDTYEVAVTKALEAGLSAEDIEAIKRG